MFDNNGGDIREPLVAAQQNTSFKPKVSSRFHVVTCDGYAACDSGMWVLEINAVPAGDVPIAERCRRPGCREHWPGAKFPPSSRRRSPAKQETALEFLARFRCTVCDVAPPVGYYTVTDEVWATAGFQQKDNACIRCLVERLGRPLTSADFKPAPVNELAIAVLKEVEKARPTEPVKDLIDHTSTCPARATCNPIDCDCGF